MICAQCGTEHGDSTACPPRLTGWTCSLCGVFVPSGGTHFCGGSTPSYVQIHATTPWDRMAAALERIATALEKK